nr:UxaA family hydrolase [uncultured Oscillibacter sp.]
MEAILCIDPADNLVTCLRAVKAGETVTAGGETVVVREDVPLFHKLAIAHIPAGAACRKYGQVIGVASRNIEKGGYVHVHNCESARSRGDQS